MTYWKQNEQRNSKLQNSITKQDDFHERPERRLSGKPRTNGEVIRKGEKGA